LASHDRLTEWREVQFREFIANDPNALRLDQRIQIDIEHRA
jgi:hypothetical protein